MNRLMWRLSGFVEILRVHNLFVSVMAFFLGFATAYTFVGSGKFLNYPSALIPLVTVILVAAGGYVINDYYDAEIDSVNKPARPIPSGRVSRGEALVLSIASILVGVAASLFVGPATFTYAAFNALLVVAYSKRLKKEGLIGNLVVSIVSANSIVFGGLSLSEIYGNIALATYSLIPATYAFTFTLMREVIKGVEDVVGDSRMGVKTLAVTRGVKYASKVSLVLMVFIIMFSPYPYLSGMYGFPYLTLVALTDALLIYSIVKLVKANSDVDVVRVSSSLRSYTKVAMFTGILAFLVDLLMRM